jgi:F420-dependent oxidoreductase-like protein
VRFSYWPAPGDDFAEIQSRCLIAEAAGWDGVWFSDHLMPSSGDPCAPVNESFTMLAALAATVPRLRLGTLVAGNTYRHPALVAKMAAGIDRISGGRFVLSLGAGWQQNEHDRYGIPFYETPQRMARLDEACYVIRRLLDDETATFDGAYYRLHEAPLSPKPLQTRLPLLIGGGGERLLLRIVARHADEWNVFATPEVLRHKLKVLERHCDAAGRDPAQIKRSVVLDPPRELRGDVSLIQRRLEAYAELGVDEVVIRDSLLRVYGPSLPSAIERFMTQAATVFRPSAKEVSHGRS